MKKKIITGILCATLGLTVAAGVGLSVGLQSNSVSAAVWNNEEITESYFLGAEFALPEAKLTIGDKTVDANVALYFPDGSATRAKKTVLNQVGTYVLKYSATVDGKPYGKEVAFVVRGDMITYGNEGTKVGYQTCAYASDPTKEYLTVSLAQSDTLKFSQLIDVSNITKDDTLVDLFISPATMGSADFNELFYQFTDSQNPDVYLKVRLKRYARASGQAYYLSGGNEQELKGLEGKNVHVNDNYGAPFSNISFDAGKSGIDETPYAIYADKYAAKLRYDATENATYAINHSGGLTLIMDQDSTQYYETLWSGFPSGKVSLSIWAQNYITSSATFCITDVRGIDLSAYGGKFEETTPPEIIVDTEYEVMPEAKLGASYAIPAAKAMDDYSGECAVDVSVWYNYASSNAVLVDVVDGKFNVDRKGYYAIVYTATDRYGNVGTKVLNVHAGNEIPQIVIAPKFEPIQTAVLGEWLEIPSDLEIVGGSGNKDVVITLSNGEERFTLEDSGFRPEKSGEWTVTYTATDYVGNVGECSYTFTTELPTAPVLVDDVALPKVFISAQPYNLPEVYANDYRTGTLSRVLCDVEVTDANETKEYKAGETFTPVVNENGDKVTLSYKYDGAVLYTAEIPTILAWVREDGTNRLQEQNYFYGEGFTTEKTGEGLKITATQADATWTFANALVSQGLNIALVAESELVNDVKTIGYTGYELTLYDLGNSQNVVRMQVVVKGSAAEFSVYGVDKTLELYCNIVEGDTLEIGFKDGCFTANGTPIAPTKTVDGKAFNGFDSEKVFASVKLLGAQADAAYRVVSVNGNPFTGKTRDQVDPIITILGDYGGYYAINSEYTITTAVASDVLAPNVNFTMSVKKPSGGFATDINGKELRNLDPSVAYTIKLTEYGQYTVMYLAEEDSSFSARPNSYEFPLGINVVDMEEPEITFSEEFQTTAKVGDVLIIPDFTVTDNLTKEENIIVQKYVCNPYGAIVRITGNSMKVDYVGVYEIRVMAMDEIGNMKLVRAYVTVTA